jgi:hypothetical protein
MYTLWVFFFIFHSEGLKYAHTQAIFNPMVRRVEALLDYYIYIDEIFYHISLKIYSHSSFACSSFTSEIIFLFNILIFIDFIHIRQWIKVKTQLSMVQTTPKMKC